MMRVAQISEARPGPPGLVTNPKSVLKTTWWFSLQRSLFQFVSSSPIHNLQGIPRAPIVAAHRSQREIREIQTLICY